MGKIQKPVRVEEELMLKVQSRLEEEGKSFNAVVVELLEMWVAPTQFMEAPVEVAEKPSDITVAPQVISGDNSAVLDAIASMEARLMQQFGVPPKYFRQEVKASMYEYDNWKQGQAPVQSPAPNPAPSTKEETGFEHRWVTPPNKAQSILDNYTPINKEDDFTHNEDGNVINLDEMTPGELLEKQMKEQFGN